MQTPKTTKRLMSLVAALVLPLALTGAATASAAPTAGKTAFPVAGDGMGTSSTVIDSRQVGTTTISHISAEVVFTGDIKATGTELFTAIVDASGTVHYHGYGVFAGTVGERSGTFEYHFTGSGPAASPGGRITFDSGMDQLQGMKGHVRWTTTATGFSYEGGVRFGG